MKNSNPRMSDEQILEKLAEIVGESLQIDPAQVTEDAYLDSLGADSLDLLEMSINTEEAFNIAMPEKSILKTAEEVFGASVLVKDGVLTEPGKEFLRQRMPELDGEQLRDTVEVHDVNRLFTRVSSWVRMIRGLMEHTPTECPQCGETFGNAIANRFECGKCGAECDLPSGEAINKQWVEEYYRKEYLPTRSSLPESSGGKQEETPPPVNSEKETTQ